MSLTHRHTVSVRTNAGTVSSADYTLTGDHEYNHEKTYDIGTDVALDMAADVSTIVSLAIHWTATSGSGSCTLETNSSSAADDTLTLLHDKPLLWDTQVETTTGATCPLTTDVTSAFVTNAAAGTLKIYILMNGS